MWKYDNRNRNSFPGRTNEREGDLKESRQPRDCPSDHSQLQGRSSPPPRNSSSPPSARGSPRRRRKTSTTKKGRGTAAPPSSTTGSTHDAPMSKKDIYFALDCEMVGVGPEGLDSALARVSIVNWDNEVVLDTFVKVPVPVTDYRTFVSGIRAADIKGPTAMCVEDVRHIVANTLRGKILIGHGLENDLKALRLTHPWCDVRDTAAYAPYMRMRKTCDSERDGETLRPRKLRDLVWEKLGRQIQVGGESHSPVEDAIAALDLYKASRMEWERLMTTQVNAAREMENARLQMKPRGVAPHKQSRNLGGYGQGTNRHNAGRFFRVGMKVHNYATPPQYDTQKVARPISQPTYTPPTNAYPSNHLDLYPTGEMVAVYIQQRQHLMKAGVPMPRQYFPTKFTPMP